MPTNPVKTTKSFNLINRAIKKSPIVANSKTTPFSLLPVLIDQVSNLLTKDTWAVGCMSFTKAGTACSPTSKSAAQWCLIGAKKAILASSSWKKYNSGVKSTVSRYFNEYVSSYNGRDTTWGDCQSSVMDINDSCDNVNQVKRILSTARKNALASKKKTK